MSSTRHSIVGSLVFQRVLVASAAFVMVSLAALWAFTWLTLASIAQAQEERISATLSYGEDLFYGESEEALIDEISSDDGPIWSEDVIYWILEEEQQIFTYRNAQNETLAGYPDLWPGEELERFPLSHSEIDNDVRARGVALRGGGSLAVAEFVPQDHHEMLGFAIFGTYALFLIVLPLSLVTGYWLSRGVFDRIEEVTRTTAAIADGDMTRRAPVNGRLDEFDRLSMGINQMLDRVDTLNSNIEAVSVGVAHDLKTPLANLGGRLELIRRDLQNGPAVGEHLEKAEGYLDQVLRIFDAILRLGEVEAGGRRAAFADLDLSQLVTEMGEAYQPVFEDGNKVLRLEIASGAMLRGDRELLQQMIANLLENALEHSRDAATVQLRLRLGDGVLVQVEDDGPGIAGPDQDRIFDRFFRADTSRSSPGNGLGLSLVKAIADLHEAAVTLETGTPGACFSVRF